MRDYAYVDGGNCPYCKATLGTIWSDDDGESYYWVEPLGRMGNKSYRDDTRIGVWCAADGCGYKKINGQGVK